MPMHVHQPIQDACEVVAGDGSLHFNGQRGFGELIGDGQNLQHPPVGGLVEREIQRPHMIRELGTQSVPGGWWMSPRGRVYAEKPAPAGPHHGIGVARACD